jgi:hypothetical protein
MYLIKKLPKDHQVKTQMQVNLRRRLQRINLIESNQMRNLREVSQKRIQSEVIQKTRKLIIRIQRRLFASQVKQVWLFS